MHSGKWALLHGSAQVLHSGFCECIYMSEPKKSLVDRVVCLRLIQEDVHRENVGPLFRRLTTDGMSSSQPSGVRLSTRCS